MDAKKTRLDTQGILEVLAKVNTVVSGRGKKWTSTELTDEASRLATAEAALGPSGNLRAPTALVGTTLLVGWCLPAWEETFSPSS